MSEPTKCIATLTYLLRVIPAVTFYYNRKHKGVDCRNNIVKRRQCQKILSNQKLGSSKLSPQLSVVDNSLCRRAKGWPYTRIGIGRFWELCPRYIGIPVGNFTVQIWFRYQPSYRISGSIEGTTLNIRNIHGTYYDYSCPLIDTGGITPCFACQQEGDISAHMVDPVKR